MLENQELDNEVISTLKYICDEICSRLETITENVVGNFFFYFFMFFKFLN